MQIKSTADLRAILLETIQQVRERKVDPKEATAIASLSARVLQSAQLDLKATQFAEQYNGALKSSTPLVDSKKEKRALA